jgi:hypothetical protein
MKGTFRLEIFEHNEDGTRKDEPPKVQEFTNSYVNNGGQLVLDALIGTAITYFSNANARIGVGDSATAYAAGQTDLQAATNKLRKGMDATFPSRSGQTMTFQSTFTTAEANFLWNEVAVFNAASGAASMLCRTLIGAPFTKTSAQSMTWTYTITLP